MRLTRRGFIQGLVGGLAALLTRRVLKDVPAVKTAQLSEIDISAGDARDTIEQLPKNNNKIIFWVPAESLDENWKHLVYDMVLTPGDNL